MIYSLLILNVINSYVIFDFMSRMYSKRYEKQYVYIVAYVVFTAIHLLVNSFRMIEVNMIYEVSCIYLLGRIMYHDRPKKAVYNITFALYLIFMDTISFQVCAVILPYSLFQILQQPQYSFGAGIIDYALVIISYRFLIRWWRAKDIDALPVRQDLLFLFLILFELITILYVWQIAIGASPNLLLFVSGSFLLLDLYIFYLFAFVTKHTALKNQMDLANQQALLLHRNIRDLERKYEKSKKVLHDVRDYIQILKRLNENKEYEMVDQYADQLHEKLNALTYRFHADNPIIKILVNDVLGLAEEKSIDFRFRVKEVDWKFISEIDLTTLLANLFNNAVEAGEKNEISSRWIEFRVGEANNHIVIFISNPYRAENMSLQKGKFMSTKDGHSGIGISNIKSVVEKYQGNVVINTDDGVFSVKIIIPQNIGNNVYSGQLSCI